MLKKPPTIKDVAAYAGVSLMAVSRVCNSKSQGQVSAAMREKVLRAINDLGYQPDVLARSLRQRHVNTVGFYNGYRDIFPLEDPFARALFIGLQDASTELDQDLLMFYAPEMPQTPEEIVRELSTSKVDGVVFLPYEENNTLFRLLGASHQTVVTIVQALPELPAIIPQDTLSGHMLAEHLYERGHRHVLYRQQQSFLSSALRRYEGFRTAALELGLQITSTQTTLRFDRVDAAEQEIIQNAQQRGITAIVGWHDYSAVMAILFCRQIGLNIPDDMAIAGFDGLEISHCPPDITLTTIEVDWSGIARRAIAFVAEGRDAAVRESTDEVMDYNGQYEIRVAGRLRVGNTT